MRAWTATVTPIPGGLSGTRATLDAMEGLVAASRRDPVVVQTAQRIVAKIPEKDAMLEADALLQWVRAHVRYTRDPIDVETVKSPRATLEEIAQSSTKRAAADCDDQVVLLAALISSIGYGTRFVAYRADGQRPSEFSHVALEADLPGAGVVTLDPIMRDWTIGQHVPDAAQFGPAKRSRTMNGFGSVPAVVNYVRPGVNGYGVGVVVSGGVWQGENVDAGEYVPIPPGVTTAQAPGAALSGIPTPVILGGLALLALLLIRKSKGTP